MRRKGEGWVVCQVVGTGCGHSSSSLLYHPQWCLPACPSWCRANGRALSVAGTSISSRGGIQPWQTAVQQLAQQCASLTWSLALTCVPGLSNPPGIWFESGYKKKDTHFQKRYNNCSHKQVDETDRYVIGICLHNHTPTQFNVSNHSCLALGFKFQDLFLLLRSKISFMANSIFHTIKKINKSKHFYPFFRE